MAVAEIIIAAFITVLFEKLASSDLIRLARSAGIYSELKKWDKILTQIQAVLVDAGEKHIRDKSVQLWLNDLQHLAYEIDDLLDDLTTEAMCRQLNQESYASKSTSKVLKIVPTKFHALNYGRKMSPKLDVITTKLKHLVNEKNLLGLSDNVQRSTRESIRLEETSLVDESKIVGRESDKEALLGKLLEDDSGNDQNVSVVSIVGLGGIGKTTLAQLLYNDKKVQDHFELMSWVCVSGEFDVATISKAIFQGVGGKNQDFANLNLLQVALKEKLSKKRFLLVLDDVWNENYNEWELLQRPFIVGARGSKVIVTTRKAMVALVMDSVQAYPLKLLSNEEALSLFAQNALGKPNFNSCPTLELLGEGIVNKCDGLPLALVAVGRVLRTKTSNEEWEEMLHSEIWNLQNETRILPALRLSYHDLPPHLKQMFAYCCLFSKDYEFEKDELVLLWMAEGYLYESKSMESSGRECFDELVSRSFFQRSTNNNSRYKMHDLMHDMAISVAGEFFLTSVDQMHVHEMNEALEKVHHLSFIRERYGVYRNFKVFERARYLRTFLGMSVSRLDYWDIFYLSNKILIELLPQLQFLRVLSLANYNIKEVPQSICGLKHMRYINLSNSRITCLPEQIGDLYNLQSLLVSGCGLLSSLPKSIVNLINLRHLDISGTPALNTMPLGISKLTGLQTLSKVIIGGADEFQISDLKGLLHLQGQLSIQELQNVTNVVQVKEANLQQKKGISDLEMEWSDVFDDYRSEVFEFKVLEGLRPFKKLKSLKILNYMGTKFPRWIGDPSFDCLTKLTLRGCRNCTYLPTLGHLSSLQKLLVESMYGLTRLGSEFLRPFNSNHGVAFPSLQVLGFADMEGWEEWSTSGGDKDGIFISFPRLHEISIMHCPNLNVVKIELIPSLRVLHVEGCSVAVLQSMVNVSASLTRLTIRDIEGLTQLHGKFLDHLRRIEYLLVIDCNEVTYLWELEADACEILAKLQTLEVKRCVNLVSLGEKTTNSEISVESLIREVKISNCPKLESYNCPNSIEKVMISSCDSVTSLTFPNTNNLPSALKNLTIEYCENLETNWLLSNFLSSLESLSIDEVPNLRFFPEGCLIHLKELSIYGCDNIESIPHKGYGFLPGYCLRSLWIYSCKKLKSFPHEHLDSLAYLEEMSVTDCPSMNYSFPCDLWPPNLKKLTIGCLKKPISEWGMQNLPSSLFNLFLQGENSGVISFAKARDVNNNLESTLFLPSSLISLTINEFKEMESVSKGLQHLTCLKHLEIYRCPKLRDLPVTLLASLSSLCVRCCSPELLEKCRSRKGKYWPIISQIPNLDIEE